MIIATTPDSEIARFENTTSTKESKKGSDSSSRVARLSYRYKDPHRNALLYTFSGLIALQLNRSIAVALSRYRDFARITGSERR